MVGKTNSVFLIGRSESERMGHGWRRGGAMGELMFLGMTAMLPALER